MQLGMDAQWDCFVAYPTARRATAEQLAKLLLARGVRVFLDVLALQPGDNWPQAIPAALEDACVTVVLVAPETELAFYAQEEIAHAVAKARGDEAHRRVVPVFLGATPDERVPYGLRIKQGYVVASPADLAHAADGIATLVEKITHQIELEADGEEPREVSPSARQHLATLRIQVEQLTRDQYRIINQLRFMRRVRISGCAGSGKTLVATEKATRLAKGGTRVLFLCHNPLLAEHVQQLTAGSGVEVRDFARWTAELAGDPPALLGDGEWTHYDEPTQDTLDRAFDQLARGEGQLDAIVVDEGQDFRDEWWGVVEAGLAGASQGFLYIFHDNNQSLLAQRGRYPIDEPHVDLSRNCRNAGRVLDLMRCFDSSAPEPELGLRDRGSVRRFEAGQDALAETLGYLEKQMLLKDAVVLVTEEGPLAGSSLAGCEVTLPTPTRWQIEVRRQFDRVLHFYERHGMRPPPGGEKWIVAQLVKLSPSSYPTYEDVEVVRSVAREFSIDRQTRAWIDENPLVRNTISFRDDGEGPRLRRRTRVRVRLRAAEVVLYFEREDWPRGLSRPRVVVLQPFYLPRAAGTLPLYRVSDFKGLEAEAVVLIMRGRVGNHREATYVGLSRARVLLCIVADATAAAVLPKSFSWDQG